MSVIQDRPEARVPISVEAFDAIVFTFFSFAALTTIARVYLWSCVLRCGVLDNVLIFIGTVSIKFGYWSILCSLLIASQASDLGRYAAWTFRS